MPVPNVQRFSVAGGWRDDSGADVALQAGDSFVVADGRVRGWAEHWERFGLACAQEGIEAGEIAAFREAVAARLPRQGRWFPRLELVGPAGDLLLRLRLRPAPPATSEAAVWTAPPGDPRLDPRRKGPDLEWLGALRERARAQGADEALLVNDKRWVLEGAYSSLLWWENDTLLAVPDGARILPGVTRRLLLNLAAEAGVRVAYVAPTTERLDGREAWLTSALHGIRRISRWVTPTITAGADRETGRWRAMLDSLGTRIV